MAGIVPDIKQILTWIGLDTARKRDGVTTDLLHPDGLVHLNNENAEGIKAACTSYTKFAMTSKFSLSRVQQKRLISLMYWVQDRYRTREIYSFDAGITEPEFLSLIQDAYERHDSRKIQRTMGLSLLGGSFSIQLESRHQWKRWSRELHDTLSSIIGVTGVPISYVTRSNANPTLIGFATWEEKVIAASPIVGRDFKQDAKTVHNLIMKNLSENSEAYTYIENSIDEQDGRVDIIALRTRYSNKSADDVLGNEAKESFRNLVYKNERAMSFEKFQERSLKSINDLSKANRPMNSADIIDEIWQKIQHPGLNEYIAALQVQQNFNPITHDQILQCIAIQIPKLAHFSNSNRRNLSEITSGDSRYTREGQAPSDGVYSEDGAIFIGNYSSPQWNSLSVRPFHEEITKARTSQSGKRGGSGHKSRSNKKASWKVKTAKRKLSKLKRQVEVLQEKKRTVSALITDGNDTAPVESTALVVRESESQAGTAFGGKNAKRIKNG